jgi:hypothetical protein
MATLTGGKAEAGWFLSSGTADPVKIALQREATPTGGWFGLLGRSGPAQITSSGRVVFMADVPDADAVALFSWSSAEGVVTVASTNDDLPAGANTLLRAGPPAKSDTEVVARALQAGGKATYYAVDLKPGATGFRKVVGEFDKLADVGTLINPGNFSINGKGEAVFTTPLLGAATYPASGFLASRPGSGLQRVVLVGDDLPGGGHASTSLGPPQLNNQSQVAIPTGTDIPNVSGIFLASLDAQEILQVIRAGDAWPGADAVVFGTLNTSIALNDAGQVAFLANSSQPVRPGLFLGSAGAPPIKIVDGTDAAPAGSFSSVTVPFQLNADGRVAFFANYGSGSSAGSAVFVGSSSEPPQPIAITGAAAPGTNGENYAFINSSTIDLNSAGQVAFWSGICCGGPGNGWYVGAVGSDPTPRLLQSQDLPGGGRVSNLNSGVRYAALSESGELAIYVGNTSGTDMEQQIVIAGADGKLRGFAGNGEMADGTDGQYGKLYPVLIATPAGRFIFSAMLVNGLAKGGIFVSVP